MDLTSSLDSKEALSYINNVFRNFVTSKLHSEMCKNNKLNVYRELKEILSARGTCMECLTWALSFCSDLDLESMV